MTKHCPVCNSSKIVLFKEIGKFSYYECQFCDVIFIAQYFLDEIDAGRGLVSYNRSYWTEELCAARERSWGAALARVAEVFLYARLRIDKFIDIGSGPGYLLDSLQYQLPSSSHIFYANELFPPAPEYCTKNNNYSNKSLLDFEFSFDAGCCIEVIEHLTPGMVKKLFADLAKKSKENSIYIFNTGLSAYIKNEDVRYLDPFVRGHIMGWSVNGVRHVAASSGFEILPIPGKTWAFIAEYKPIHHFKDGLRDRIWRPITENVSTLKDKKTGDLMYIVGLDAARAYS